MIHVDLHCHSSFSDGDLTPEQLAQELSDAGVLCAALTDHDNLKGQSRFHVALKNHGIRFISGLELEVQSNWGPFHILAYNFDLENRCLQQTVNYLNQPLWYSCLRWLRRHLSPRNSDRSAEPEDCSIPFGHEQLTASAAISLIHHAAGLAFLAHPLSGPLTLDDLDEFLLWLKPQGLDGIEAFYKPYSRQMQSQLCEIALRHNLLVSAGSDFHRYYFTGESRPGHFIPLTHWASLENTLSLKIV